MSERDGYHLRHADGTSEFVSRPKCRNCGGDYEVVQLQEMEAAAEGSIVAEVRCTGCNDLLCCYGKPTEADLERGRELARKYGW